MLADPTTAGATGPSPALTPTIADLSDSLLVRCLAPLSQEERLMNAALVCRRWGRVCLAPTLLHSIRVPACHSGRAGSRGWALPRLQALLRLLQQHAAHVRSLKLTVLDREAEASALVSACLAACGTAGSLERLTVDFQGLEPMPAFGWLCRLTKLRQLGLHCVRRPLRLPASISRLTALTGAELCGSTVRLDGALPPNLTQLWLCDRGSTQLPPQLAALSSLDTLELECSCLAADGLASLSRLAALRMLSWNAVEALPASAAALTQLQALSTRIVRDDVSSDGAKYRAAAVEAALPHLQGLTALSLWFEYGKPGSIPAALACLPKLHRLHLGGDVDCPNLAALAVPPGPWLASLRWLGLPWALLATSAEALRGATRLEYLASQGAPQDGEEGSAERQGWATAWSLLEVLPALRFFSIELEPGSSVDAHTLLHALCRLQRRQPALTWRSAEPNTFERELFDLSELPPDF